MQDVPRVVLGLESPDVIDEVMHFIDRSGRAQVVATAVDDRQLSEAVRQLDPDAVVAEPTLAREGTGNTPLLALTMRESVASLRAAIRAGARDFYAWPQEREGLIDGVAGTLASRSVSERKAIVIAVHGARGGAGVTFVASHLAAACARNGVSVFLIDADVVYGDLAPALGVPADARSIGDLAVLGTDIFGPHVLEASWEHPNGFRILIAPPAERVRAVTPTLVGAACDAAATVADLVIVHLPRSVDAGIVELVDRCDRFLEVLSLDVLGFRAAARALELFAPEGVDDRIGFVVNRAGRGEVVPADVRRAFGAEPLVVIPMDGAVQRAQDHGRLLPARGRTGRGFARLARAVLTVPAKQEVAS